MLNICVLTAPKSGGVLEGLLVVEKEVVCILSKIWANDVLCKCEVTVFEGKVSAQLQLSKSSPIPDAWLNWIPTVASVAHWEEP